MADNSISTYEFKPLNFTEKNNKHGVYLGFEVFVRNKVVCNDDNIIALGFNMQDPREERRYELLWKYSYDLSEWRIVPSKNIPYGLDFNSFILSGNIAIIIGCKFTARSVGVNRVFLGNLADEHKEGGIQFKELKMSGDIHKPIIKRCILVDGQYVYIVGVGPEDQMINIHRVDLRNRKWEFLTKSCVECPEENHLYQHYAVFYKGGIYVFGYERKTFRTDYYTFLELYKFDVAKKKWDIIPVDPELWPSIHYKIFLSSFFCIQCPENSNIVYTFGTSLGDVCRFNIDNLQWEKLKWEFPLAIFLLSNSVAPSGRICRYGNLLFSVRTAWLTIPTLKTISWEAMIYYFKEQLFASSDERLKEIGLPKEFYERIIEARRYKTLK